MIKQGTPPPGGSLLCGLDRLIERVTNIPTYVAKKPISIFGKVVELRCKFK
ncbi:MAG: hypothetical protein ACI4WV_05290 [Eubacteriales bacterium]